MPSRWQDCVLGDAITLKRGYDLPAKARKPGSIPIVSSSGFSGVHSESMVTGPGVVTGRYGTIGKVFYVDRDFWPLNTTLYVQNFKGNDPRFICYLLRTVDFLQFSDKAAVPGVNRNHLHTAQISLPPLKDQIAIARVLQSMDDRIDLLHQTNNTLESVAQALFKSWFIDFDPVKAQTEGREPEGMGADTAALFPSEFEDSAQGLIPKGWAVGSVYGIAKVIYGAPFASTLFNTAGLGLPLVRIRDLRNEAPGVWTPEALPKGCKINPGDIVVGMDGEFRAYLWGGEVAWMNQRICKFVPIEGHSAAFVRGAIARPLAHIEATQTATTVIHLGKGDIDRFRVIIPPVEVASAFKRVTDPLYSRLVASKEQARALMTTRDLLLPRLISGKLRLPEAREVIAAI